MSQEENQQQNQPTYSGYGVSELGIRSLSTLVGNRFPHHCLAIVSSICIRKQFLHEPGGIISHYS